MDIKLVVVGGKQAGKEIPVPGPKFLIGRGSECRLQPRSHMVSRKHCAISLEQDSLFIEDLCSTNGTFVNEEKIDQRRELKHGDRIKVGLLELEVQVAAGLSGKYKPKVTSVQEAAARTVASAAARDDADIDTWLEQDGMPADVAAQQETPAVADTAAAQLLDDTADMPAEGTRQDKKNAVPAEADKQGKETGVAADVGKQDKQSQPPATVAGRFQSSRKPIAANSRSAADDALSSSSIARDRERQDEASVRAADDVRKSAALLGLAFDNHDGHTRITRGENFLLLGGCKETHAVMQETAIKINEQLDRRKKRLEDVSPRELRNICREVVNSVRPQA